MSSSRSLPLRLRLAQEAFGRAVVVSEDIGILQKLIGGDHGLEFLFGNEEVLLAVLFAAPGRPRGIGDGKVEIARRP